MCWRMAKKIIALNKEWIFGTGGANLKQNGIKSWKTKQEKNFKKIEAVKETQSHIFCITLFK